MPPIYSKEWNRITIQVRGDHRQGRTSPCEHACPLGNGIQQMHTLIAAGETGKALARLHARNPFPGITGRVCPHPCETKCNRAEYDEPVAIHALERFAADTGHETRFIPLPASGKRVAVVGSGPAGLTAARFAALLGHAVTVYESAPVMGGVPRHAVPDFRLPKDVVDRETGAVVASGVQVRTNVTVGRDITLQSLLDTYDATILAVGLWKERRLDIPGKEHLVPAVGWLKRSTLERQSLAGKTVVIAGYGWGGKGAAMRGQGMGANVIVTEVDPFKALEATMENFRVMPMDEAARYGDIFVTATGCKDVIVERHFQVMKHNVLLCNSGHFDCEVDVARLGQLAEERFPRRAGIEGFRLPDGRVLNVLAEGRLVNLAAGNGHPAEIMDMSFAVQALSLEWMARHAGKLEKKVYNVPEEIDDQIGRVKLAAMGLSIDTLTQEQKDYLAGWEA